MSDLLKTTWRNIARTRGQIRIQPRDVATFRQKMPYRREVTLDWKLDGPVISSRSATASHTVRLYLDPRCTWCHRFIQHQGKTLITLAEQRLISLEIVMVAFLDENLGGGGSRRAVTALRAMLEIAPTRFWQYLNDLYSRQPHDDADGFANAELIAVASQLLTEIPESFVTAISTHQFDSWVNESRRRFETDGVGGAPGLMIDGNLVPVPLRLYRSTGAIGALVGVPPQA